MTSDSEFSRQASLKRLESEHFDVLVIGGGITGAGCALDAAARGLSVALVEKGDFASGTSSKSSKLIHGGLRYLQQRRVVLVYEALAERQRLLRNAPHLVGILPFLIPVYTTDGLINPKVARALGTALWAYDLTGGFRIGKKHKRVSKAEALELFPTLPDDRLEHGYIYYDCEADDARLTLAILRTAALEHGAAVANHTSAVGINKDSFGACQSVSVATAEGESFDISASVVVNAAGVWADEVRLLDDRSSHKRLRPAKGIHVALPRELFGNQAAAVVPTGQDDRSIFVIPWGDTTYLGTTDTDYDGNIDSPECSFEDVEYLLKTAADNTTAKISADDILGVWAGLRPLVKDTKSQSTADLSRRHSVTVSDAGVVTIVGGKLTTYRKMAADAIDEAADYLAQRRNGKTKLGKGDRSGRGDRSTRGAKASAGSSPTVKLSLIGAPQELVDNPAAPATPLSPVVEPVKKFLGSLRDSRPQGDSRPPNDSRQQNSAEQLFPEELAEATVEHLFSRFGTETSQLLELMRHEPSLARQLHPELPYLAAEVVHAVRSEMAIGLDDILSRRLRATLLNARASSEMAQDAADLMAAELGWDAARSQAQARDYRDSIDREMFGWRR